MIISVSVKSSHFPVWLGLMGDEWDGGGKCLHQVNTVWEVAGWKRVFILEERGK